MICVGQLSRRLTIQQSVSTPDDAGGSDTSWSDVATVWAKIRPLHGNEKLIGDTVTSRISHKVTIRFRSDLLPSLRFASDERFFDILSVVNIDEQNIWLECLCTEVNN